MRVVRGRGNPRLAAIFAALVLGPLLVLAAAVAVSAGAATSTPYVQVVFENPDYGTLAVGRDGAAYGTRRDGTTISSYRLYRSVDEGRTWSARYDFPATSRLKGMSALSSGTLLAHIVNTDEYLYRSSDGGASWQPVLHFPLLYGVLTAHSVADDGSHAYVASYNTLNASSHTNWVWRSDDDGRTWSVVRETTSHRHAHGVQVDPASGAVYVAYGDSASQAAIERSRDRGDTWETLCTGTACLAVDLSFGNGFAVFGTDQPSGGASIRRVDLANGVSTKVRDIPGASYASFRIGDAFLVGTTREPNGAWPANDPDVHLYLSFDGAQTFVDGFQIPWRNPSGYIELRVQFAYPNGDFPIQVSGYGTIVARLVGSSPPPPPPSPPTNTALPAISGSAIQGETLAASPGSWSGAPTAFAYQWLRCDSAGAGCAAVAGAVSASFLLTATDAGSTLRVRVTASNAGGSSAATSAASAVVTVPPPPPPPSPPTNTALPAIGGSAVQGETLGASAGSWSGAPTAYAYQWLRCDVAGLGCAAVTGAVSASFVVAATDVGATLRVRVTASNAGGSSDAISAPTAVVTAPSPPPTVPSPPPVSPPSPPPSLPPAAPTPAPQPPTPQPSLEPPRAPTAVVLRARALTGGRWYWAERLAATILNGDRLCRRGGKCLDVERAICAGRPLDASGRRAWIWNTVRSDRLYRALRCSLRATGSGTWSIDLVVTSRSTYRALQLRILRAP